MLGTRIYIGNLSARVTETDLEDEFKKFGYVRNVWIARQPPGFAFVVMEDGRDAEDAIRKLDGLSGWKVEYARHDGSRRQDRNRYGPPNMGGESSGHMKREYRGGGGGGMRPFHGRRNPRYTRNWNHDRNSPNYNRNPRRSRSRSRDRSHRERSRSGGRASSYDRSHHHHRGGGGSSPKGTKLRERSRSLSPMKSKPQIEATDQQQQSKEKTRDESVSQKLVSKESIPAPDSGAD
eukprot:g3254.t1